MVLNRLTCPECSAGIESSAGYTPGQVVRCPKCETEFTVEDGGGSGAGSPMQPAPRRAGESDDFQPSARRASADAAWTYKNSWVRYAVLGVLLAVLGVLGYLLYQKRMNEGKEMAGGNGDEESVRPVDAHVVGPARQLVPFVPGGGGAVTVDRQKKEKTEPKKAKLTPDEIKTQLVGVWGNKKEQCSMEYKADGTFLYKVEKEGMPAKSIAGKWKVVNAEDGSSNPDLTVTIVNLEWTAEGKSAIKDGIFLRSDGLSSQPLLDQLVDGKKVVTVFSKKKE